LKYELDSARKQLNERSLLERDTVCEMLTFLFENKNLNLFSSIQV